MIKTIEWAGDSVVMIDQRLLPNQEIYHTCRTHHEVAEAIKTMVIRGAPAIGVAAAMGIALGVKNFAGTGGDSLAQEFEAICEILGRTRPTAVNLFWAIGRMRQAFESVRSRPPEEIKKRLEEEALAVFREDIARNERMGRHGQELLKDGSTVLTHCNAGALATAGYGTALGVIRAAVESGKKIAVVADETRPFLQGSRLTAWELVKDGIPVTLITDNTAGSLMRSGRIHSVIVGADRIAANGDVANKIGTYPLAVLARENGIPFYVAAPTSTVDLSVPDGDHIPIEERDPAEVLFLNGQPIAPPGVQATNLAFDVTPHRYVTAIITESGVATAPYGETLARMVRGARG